MAAPSLNLQAASVTSAGAVPAALGGNITAASLTETLSSSSSLSVTFEDSKRAVISKPVFAKAASVTASGRSFALTRLSPAGSAVTVVFEDLLVATLRTKKGALLAKTGGQTRTEFAGGLVQAVGGTFYGQQDELIEGTTQRGRVVSQGQIGRGSSSDASEDSWTCLTRLAQELDWRCFSDGKAVWFGSDAWLKTHRGPVVKIRENQNGLGWLSGDYSPNDPTGNDLSFTTTAPWDGGPGRAVFVDLMGPLNGTWLVQQTVTGLSVSTQVTLTRAQADVPALPSSSSSLTQATGVDGQVLLGNGTAAAGTVAARAVTLATGELGVRYVYGGASPSGFDCSGLTQWVYARLGISIPRTAAAQFSALAGVPSGQEQAGDLLFFREASAKVDAPSHVGIYVGGGRMIDAPHTGSVVRYDTVRTFEVYLGARRP